MASTWASAPCSMSCSLQARVCPPQPAPAHCKHLHPHTSNTPLHFSCSILSVMLPVCHKVSLLLLKSSSCVSARSQFTFGSVWRSSACESFMFIYFVNTKHLTSVICVSALWQVRTLRMHLYTLVQLTCLSVLWVVMATAAALAFPFMLLLTIPVRMLLLPRLFSRRELQSVSHTDVITMSSSLPAHTANRTHSHLLTVTWPGSDTPQTVYDRSIHEQV